MPKAAFLCAALALVLATATTAATDKVISFKSPSGNIGCIYGDAPAYVRCDIRSGLKPKPPQLQGCDLEYGDSISMNRTGRAHLVCHGDTAFDPRAKVVRYGTVLHVGPFACTSRTAGLTCKNASAHGFFISRESYRLF